MAAIITTIEIRDGENVLLPGGVRAVDLSGTGDGPFLFATAQTSPPITRQTVTITNGNSQSPAIDLGVARPRAIQTPATLTATVISFLASGDGGSTFAMVQDGQGTELTIAVSVNRFVVLEPAWFDGCQVLKLRLGTASAPITTEGADRSFFLVSQ